MPLARGDDRRGGLGVAKRKAAKQADLYPLVFETFREIGAYDVGTLTRDKPSAFNGMVSVVKYRVTVERIEEPVEVIRARIQRLWDECDNHHQWAPLRAAAAQVGLTLNHSPQRRR